MKNEKIKIEIDLLRDSLRNIFVVMFSIMSSLVGLGYKIIYHFNKVDLVFLFVFIGLIKLRMVKLKELNTLLKNLEEIK